MSNAIIPAAEKLKNFSAFLSGKKSYLAQVLPKHLTPERVIKVAITAASRTPALLRCTQESFALAVIQASQLGLEAGSPLGEAYLVPFGTECQLIVGYRGFIALARRSGEMESIEARVVHARDAFEIEYGLDPRLIHRPFMAPPPVELSTDPKKREGEFAEWSARSDPGPLVAVYAVARLKGGQTQVEVMTRAQVEAIRQRSRASSNGPWVTDYNEMARKTVVRRLVKYLPLSIEMAEAVAHDDRTERGEPIDATAVVEGMELGAGEIAQTEPTKPTTATSSLKSKLGAAQPPTIPAPPEDDEPPPTGTDGPARPAPSDGEDHSTEAAAFEEHQRATKARGSKASAHRPDETSPRWLREHLAAIPSRGHDLGAGHVAASYWKRSDDFTDAGTHAECLAVVLTELSKRGVGNPASWLQAVGEKLGHVRRAA